MVCAVRGGFQSVEEVFVAFAVLAKVRTMRFATRLPEESEIREEESVDIVLVGGGMTIKLKSGGALIRVTDKRISYGVGSALWDADHSISIDNFPNLRVEIYKHRGRPQEDFKRAQILGERDAGEKPSTVGKKFGMSEDTVRHYRDRDAPRLKGRGGARASAPPDGEAKTSGN